MSNAIAFSGIDCDVVETFYDNGQPGLFLVAKGTPRSIEQGYFDGQPLQSITACLAGTNLEPRQTLLAEHAYPGLLGLLEQSGIAKDTGRTHASGFAVLRVIELS